MRTIATNQVKARAQKKQNQIIVKLRHFLLEPVSAGLFGFALFFSILLITKLAATFIGTFPSFQVDFGDVTLSLIGFLLMFLIKLLENINSKMRG